MTSKTRMTAKSKFFTAILLTLMLSFTSAFNSDSFASASPSSVIDDGTNQSGWTNDVQLKAGVGNPGSAFTFSKNSLIGNSFGANGSDFSGASIKFDIVFNASTDYLGVWWGKGIAGGPSIANGLYMGPAGNPNSASGWMSGKIGLIPNMGPCIYYCVSGSVSSSYSWDVGRWYTVEVKISANSTSYYVDNVLVQTIATTLPLSNYVTFGGDDRTGWGFSDGVYVDNIAITPPPRRSVIYNVAGSTASAPTQIDVLQGSTFTVAGGILRDLYDFSGWTDGMANYQPGDSYTAGSSNIELTAVWQPKTYTLNFESHGGSSVAAGSFNNVDNFVEPLSPTKNGFTFVGWSRTEDGPVLDSSHVFSETATVTLHAAWSSDSMTLSFDSQGGSAVEPIILEIGTVVSAAPNEPTRPGYTFGGWTSTLFGQVVTFPYSPVLTVGYRNSVTAANLTDIGTYQNVGRWKSSTWYGPERPGNHLRDVVTFKDGLKYGAIRESNNSVLSNPTRLDGYYLIPLDRTAYLFATWTAENQTITYDTNRGNSATPTQTAVATDSTFTIASAPSRSGYSFDGWSDGTHVYEPGGNYLVGPRSVLLTAIWTALTNTVTYSLGGVAGNAPTQAAVASDTNFTVASAPTRPGFTFAGWSDGSNVFQPGEAYFVSTEPVTLTATWTANPIRSITFIPGGGLGSTPAGPISLASGLDFQLPQNTYSRGGFAFAGWSDGASVLQPGDTYTVGNSNITLTATWTPLGVNFAVTMKNLPGFALDSFVLTKSMKLSLDNIARQSPSNTEITCTGYTMGPRILRTDKSLALNRAKVVCNYLVSKNANLRGFKIKTVNTKSISAFARRTSISSKTLAP